MYRDYVPSRDFISSFQKDQRSHFSANRIAVKAEDAVVFHRHLMVADKHFVVPKKRKMGRSPSTY